MSDLIVIQPQVTELTVTEDVNQVVVSSVGVQGAKGDTGATGATGAKGDTGAQGPSGVIAVTAPITNSGTSTSANIGVSAGSTSTAGVLQLTDSTSSTSTTTAATPNAVKTAYDALLPRLNIVALRSGSYYANANFNSAFSPAANITHYHPFFIPNAVTLDRLQFITTGTFSGTASVRLGIYADNGGIPGNLILDAGTVSATAANTVYAITISQSVTAGTLYWVAFNAQTAATVNAYAGQTGSPAAGQPILNFLTGSDFTMVTSYRQTGVTGAFANAVSPAQTGNAIRMAVRVA